MTAASSLRLAIVVPVLNEAAIIAASLERLQPLRARGVTVVVVDGGSRDETVGIARTGADRVIEAGHGRARQMNAGATHARDADVLLFLHADTQLPEAADRLVLHAVERGARWGRFDVRIDGRSRALRLIAALMNLRSRATGICTGDQALFVERRWFGHLGGFCELPLMEDVEFSRRARRLARPAALTPCVVTSGRRWERRGVWRTVWLMWSLRWRYWRGEDPAILARRYTEAR